VNLTEIFRNPKLTLVEGGNLEIDNPNFDPTQPESPTNTKVIQAQEIQLAPTEISDEVQDRTHMVGVLKTLFMDINKTFTVIYKTPLFNPAILDKEIKDFMAGSSQHFFDLLRPNPNFNPKHPESETNPKMIGLSDEEFKKYKPKVGDIDIQCNQDLKEQLLEFLNNHINVPIGNETLLGAPSSGNEQYNTLWQLADPPIKLQIDFEYGKYSPITQKPDEWTKFSHSSAWEDIQQNIKGVFHKYIYRALAKAAPEAKYIAKLTGLGKKRAMGLFGGSDGKEQFTDVNNPPAPFIDANFGFSVASKGGGGVRAKYKPVEPGTGIPTEINGLPVMHELKSSDSEYEQDLNKQFVLFFGKVPQGNDRSLQNSFLGTLELMNKYLDDNGKRNAASDFFDIVFEPGSQMLTKGDPQRDYATKFAAIDKMLAVLGLEDMKQTAETMAQEYEQDYNDVEAFRQANPNVKQPRAAMRKQRELVKEEAQVKAQLRKGMPHLHDLKPADLLDLLDEIHDGNGSFKLQNIPLNVKVDGFGGRFGKNSEGKPFMGTSRTEPRYAPGFVAYHEKKGTTDPEILGRAQLFDELFEEMMNAVKLVDSKLGPGFLVNKQVTCEVLYLPFATETPEGKLKFVGIHYDKLPAGVKLALVPFRITDATSGNDLPNADKIVKELISTGRSGSVMFIDNSLTQNEALDVTALVPPVENIEQMKALLASNKLEARRQVKAALEPVATALEKAIIEDPNIIGKDLLGQDYEGIVINSRLGPIKVTSQEQRDVITAKNAAKVNARTERPRGEAKTAVVAIGSFIGHKGHEDLFKYTIDKAKEVGGDPYLFIGNAEGKDDPIPPAVKVQTWHKLYPQYAQNISTVSHEGGTLIQKIKHELINPLPGKPPRYDNIVIMVGEDRAGLNMPNALMKAVNKFQGYEHVKVSLEVTPREAGVSGTALRNSLKNDPPEKALSTWSNAFDVNKLGVDWIKHLMDITRKGMGIQEPQQPAQQKQPVPQPAPVAEQRLFNALIRPLHEGTSIDSTLRAIINDIGEPITSVYDTMKFQAKKYMENHGELGRGFRMVAAGVGGRWVQNMYIGRLHNELHDLTKYNTRRTVDLQEFLRGEENDGEIEMKRSFGNLANNLPPILARLGQHLNAPQLTKNAQRWMQNKAEYERYLMDLEAEGDEPDDEPVKIKPEKSNVIGQQNAQVDKIVNDILSKVPKNIAGDIRNAIARAPNKLAALKQELDKHHLNMAEGATADMRSWFAGQERNLPFRTKSPDTRNYDYPKEIDDILKKIKNREGLKPQEFEYLKKWKARQDVDEDDVIGHMAKDLTGHGSPIAKAAAQRDKKREQQSTQSHGRAEGPKWGVAEGYRRIAGLMTDIANPQNLMIKDPDTFKEVPAAEYFKSHPEVDQPTWQQEVQRSIQAMAQNKQRQQQGLVVNPLTGEQQLQSEVDAQRKELERILSPEEQEQFISLKGLARGRFLKQVWAKKADQKQFANLMKVHWTGGAQDRNKLEQILSGRVSSKAELSARMYKNQEEIPGNKPGWGTDTIGLVLDGWTTIAGFQDLRSDNQKIGKGSADRSQQKYTVQPQGVATDVNKVKATQADIEQQGGWNEALVDNWKVKAAVVTNGADPESIALVQKYKIPIIDRRTNPAAPPEAPAAPTGTTVAKEARMSAAQRLWNAEQKQRAKSDASLARTPSSIPKPEPKKDEKIAEKLKTGPAAHFTPKDAHVKRGQFVGGDAVSEDVETIMDNLINKIIVNEAISNNRK